MILYLSFLWFISHLLILGFLLKQKRFFIYLLLFLITIFYFNIGLTGDMSHGYFYDIQSNLLESRFIKRGEVGFAYMGMFFNNITGNYKDTLYLFQFFEFLFFLYLVKIFYKKSFLGSLLIGVLSLSFFLGLENVYRQGVASIFILIGSYFLIESKIYFIVFYIIAQLFHYSSIFFELIILFIFFLKKSKFPFSCIKINFLKYIFVIMLFTLLFYFLIKFFYTYFPISRNNDRDFGLLKVGTVGIIYFLSSYFFSKSLLNGISYFLFIIRGVFFSIFIASSLVGGAIGIELASRILFFYFWIEAVLAIREFFNGKNSRLGSIIILLSYGLAINVYILLKGVGKL